MIITCRMCIWIICRFAAVQIGYFLQQLVAWIFGPTATVFLWAIVTISNVLFCSAFRLFPSFVLVYHLRGAQPFIIHAFSSKLKKLFCQPDRSPLTMMRLSKRSGHIATRGLHAWTVYLRQCMYHHLKERLRIRFHIPSVLIVMESVTTTGVCYCTSTVEHRTTINCY
jgi:hypothetical protein